MLDVTHSHIDVEIEFGVVSLILIFLESFTSKMIFSILQVSSDRKRLLTASVRHLSNVVYCKKGHCHETVKFTGCTREIPQYSRDLFRAKTLANWFYCNVGCHVFRNRQRKIKKCNCIMLENYIFRQTSAKFFTEDKQQHYRGDLVLGWAVLQKIFFYH